MQNNSLTNAKKSISSLHSSQFLGKAQQYADALCKLIKNEPNDPFIFQYILLNKMNKLIIYISDARRNWISS